MSTAHTINAPGVNAGIGGVSASIAPTVTVDRWIQWNANGAPTRDDTSIINGTNPAGLLLQRVVQVGRTTMVYDAPTRTTTVMTATMAATRAAPPERPVVPDPFNPVSLRRFVLDAQQGTAHDARLLPRQMLDGVTVDVVQVMRALPGYGQGNTDKTPRQDTVTFYVDAGTYALRQVDIASVNAKGALLTSSIVRVVIYALVPAASVPSTVFSLHAPANGRVVTVPHTR